MFIDGSSYDGIRSCEICGEYTTGILCSNCNWQRQIDESQEYDEDWHGYDTEKLYDADEEPRAETLYCDDCGKALDLLGNCPNCGEWGLG